MENREGNGSFFWVEETNDGTPSPMMHKRKVKSKKLEFVGWGSKLLIEFLQSVGKDTGTQLSQYDVTTVINEYAHTSNLFHPVKKKKIVCDERLRALFGKKSLPRIKIYELLKSHFAENHDSSEDDQSYSSEEYNDLKVTGKKQACSSEKRPPYQKIKAAQAPLSYFAAIIPENIKLLYLKRRLVQELAKHPESFEGKLLGSYIRVKSDPNDYSQKNSHQLLPVIGVKFVPSIGAVHEEFLQVPNRIKDISICMLSDDDFSKEECEDLCQRVKDGLLKRPTVVEFEQKAQLLHEDITKDWLPRELAYLQNLIDRANEKGWRRELFEYLERRKLLQTPSEQSKLLAEVPKVTADTSQPEDVPEEHVQDVTEVQALPSCGADAAGGNRELMEKNGDGGDPISVQEVKVEKRGLNLNLNEDKCSGSVKSAQHPMSFQWIEVEKSTSLGKASKSNNVEEVIELSDDEEQEDKFEDYRPKWFYLDPQGHMQGPVSRYDLRQWSDAGYFSPGFKVWKDGQTPENAILLSDMLS